MSCPAVCTGAMLHCSFGIAPATLNVLPTSRTIVNSLPMANIMDNKPFVNILPFGMCNSIANPTVAAATAAALGVLTPMPCIPAISAPRGTRLTHGISGQYSRSHRPVTVALHVGRRYPD